MKDLNCLTATLILTIRSFSSEATAWVLIPRNNLVRQRSVIADRTMSWTLAATARHNEWGVTDDWNQLSSENQGINSEELYNQDWIGNAALELEQHQQQLQQLLPSNDTTNKDVWLEQALDAIVTDEEAPVGDRLDQSSFVDAMGTEISLLVRCNESPEQLLIAQGRALPPLTQQERDNVEQLLTLEDRKPTAFFQKAIQTIFLRHAMPMAGETMILDHAGVAQWLQTSLGLVIGKYDKRVNTIISKYSKYGSGYLVLQDMEKLYYEAVIGNQDETTTLQRLQQYRSTEIQNVWRDIRNHGILAPVEQERVLVRQELEAKHGTVTDAPTGSLLLDECDIVQHESLLPEARARRETKSSHESVVLADDKETPLYMKDGEFVFIDEESCIGCTQCVLAAPASFHMTYEGRAQTFCQRNSPDVAAAVNACPVDCMHDVSFRELKELENARDKGDGRSDHRHFGQSPERGYIGRTPLHVKGMASDSNHRSSWYHFLSNKCYMSKQCPQKGCYNCPVYRSNPDSNPYFQQRLKEATHLRAKHFMDHGIADQFRKTADL